MIEEDLGGADAVFVGGVADDFEENGRDLIGDGLGAVDGDVLACEVGIGEGVAEVGILGFPSPEG